MLISHNFSPPSQAVRKCVPPSCTSLSQTGAGPGTHFQNLCFGEKSLAAIAQTLARLSALAIGYSWQMAESWLNPGFGDQVHAYFAQPLATLAGCEKMCTSILHQSVTDRCESKYTFSESWFWGPIPSSCRTQPWPDSQNLPWGTHGKWLNPG